MPVIDVQVHPFDRNHPGRPWASPSHGLDSATGEGGLAICMIGGEIAPGIGSSAGVGGARHPPCRVSVSGKLREG